MNLAAVLLIQVAEAFVLLGIVLLLRLRNRIASRVAPGASHVAPGSSRVAPGSGTTPRRPNHRDAVGRRHVPGP